MVQWFKSRYKLLLSVILMALLVWLIGFGLLWLRRNNTRTLYLQGQTTGQALAWQAMLSSHNNAMEAFFETYIRQPDVMTALQHSNRHQLYRLLQPTYHHLINRHVRQLHFHTADNHSFLRLHAPDLFGDSLAEERPSVVLANSSLHPVHGFETGRIVAGFRNVYPIIWQGRHLGSVELSQPFEALRKEMHRLDPDREFQLVFRKNLLWPKLIESQKKTYAPSVLGPEWVIEDPQQMLKDSPPPLSTDMSAALNIIKEEKEFRSALERRVPSTLPTLYRNQSFKVTLLPQIDVEGKQAAVLISIAKAPDLDSFRKSLWTILLGQTLFVLFGSVMFYLYMYNRTMLKEKQQYLGLIGSTIADGLYVIDVDGHITFANARTTELLGYTQNELLGAIAHDLFYRHPEGNSLPLDECPVYKVIKTKGRYEGEELFGHKDGIQLSVQVASQPMVKDNQVVGAVIVFRDISEKKLLVEQLRLLSVTDPLTGIFNRRFLQETLYKELSRAERHDESFSLVMLDIDHFKHINDQFGHDVGDRVLRHIVKLIQDRIRHSDCLARWGGEEFMLLLPNTTVAAGKAVAETLLQAMRSSNAPEAGTVTASFGVVGYRTGDTADGLMKRVDDLMYTAKQAGRNCIKAEDA